LRVVFGAPHTGRHADGQAAGWHISRYDGARASSGSVPQRYRRDEHRIAADKNIISYVSMILLAVRLKIARDDPRRHIRARADRGVANIAEVVHLHIITQRRVFYLGKITDMCAGA